MPTAIAKSKPKSNLQIVILYGQSEIGKPRAGVFKGANVDPALKAAPLLQLSALKVDSPEERDLAAALPAGRIQAKGQAIVPFVRDDLYKRLADLTNATAARSALGANESSSGPSRGATSSKPKLPRDWDSIGLSHLVIAQYADIEDGWWQAVVVGQEGHTFRLRWQNERRGRPFLRNRFTLALVYPGDEARADMKSGGKGGTDSALPQNWRNIHVNQIVLAKEEGPVEQWWEAKVVSWDKDKDVFTLQWRDYPHLPPISRPRLALGLLNPNPKPR